MQRESIAWSWTMIFRTLLRNWKSSSTRSKRDTTLSMPGMHPNKTTCSGTWEAPFNDKVATLLLKKPVNLYLSSFKVMNRFLLKEVIKYTGPDPYVDAIVLRTTDNIGTMLVEHHQRPSGRSGYTLGKLISIWGSMVVSYSLVPLRLIGIVGLLLTAGGIVYGIFKAYDDLHTYGKLTDFETLMSANLIFRGLTMMAVSILGEYVGRIYVLLNHDPQFVVRELVTSDRKQGQVKNLSSYKGRDEQILSSGNS